MILSDLPAHEFDSRIEGPGLAFRTGPFNIRVRSPLAAVARGVRLLYADYPFVRPDEFVDYEVVMDQSGGWRRWFRSQVLFRFDGSLPFEPLPVSHAYPLFEWAMNWCISTQSHQYLMLHAAVIERGGLAAILPAPPGSGKSTLCASLIHRGWRLLSDELTLISPHDMTVSPLCRPVSLKNQSIDILRAYEPSGVFGDVTPDTSKGAVGHMKAPAAHVRRMDDTAVPAWVVFPKYVAGAAPRLAPRPRAGSALELGRNAFNYTLLGRLGFDTICSMVERCDCFDFSYSQLDDAVRVFDALAEARGA